MKTLDKIQLDNPNSRVNDKAEPYMPKYNPELSISGLEKAQIPEKKKRKSRKKVVKNKDE